LWGNWKRAKKKSYIFGLNYFVDDSLHPYPYICGADGYNEVKK
jgi:hypothetical protein